MHHVCARLYVRASNTHTHKHTGRYLVPLARVEGPGDVDKQGLGVHAGQPVHAGDEVASAVDRVRREKLERVKLRAARNGLPAHRGGTVCAHQAQLSPAPNPRSLIYIILPRARAPEGRERKGPAGVCGSRGTAPDPVRHAPLGVDLAAGHVMRVGRVGHAACTVAPSADNLRGDVLTDQLSRGVEYTPVLVTRSPRILTRTGESLE